MGKETKSNEALKTEHKDQVEILIENYKDRKHQHHRRKSFNREDKNLVKKAEPPPYTSENHTRSSSIQKAKTETGRTRTSSAQKIETRKSKKGAVKEEDKKFESPTATNEKQIRSVQKTNAEKSEHKGKKTSLIEKDKKYQHPRVKSLKEEEKAQVKEVELPAAKVQKKKAKKPRTRSKNETVEKGDEVRVNKNLPDTKSAHDIDEVSNVKDKENENKMTPFTQSQERHMEKVKSVEPQKSKSAKESGAEKNVNKLKIGSSYLMKQVTSGSKMKPGNSNT